MYLDLNQCEYCTKRCTTMCNSMCKIYNVKQAISQLQTSIDEIEHKESVSIIINKTYSKNIIESIDFKNIKYYTSSNTPEDVVAVLVNDLKIEEFEQYGIEN